MSERKKFNQTRKLDVNTCFINDILTGKSFYLQLV